MGDANAEAEHNTTDVDGAAIVAVAVGVDNAENAGVGRLGSA